MEIIVEGTGKKYITPDEVNMNFTFVTKGSSYEEVLEKGVQNVESFINTITKNNQFNSNDMKTRSFIIKEDTKYNEATRKYEFDGYSYNQNASIRFCYEKEKMARLMEMISKIENPPIYQVYFGVKDKNKCRREVVELAYKDAEEQAYAIALAAGKTLKECIKIDFKPFNTENYISNSTFKEEYYDCVMSKSADIITNIFTPEDIEIKETLYCLWTTE